MHELINQYRINSYYCGLPEKFLVQLRVLQYTQMDITTEEYNEYYTFWTLQEKQMADDMLAQIADAIAQKVVA